MKPVTFSAEWFEAHQPVMLWLLNHPLTRRWARWILRIRRSDAGYSLPIVELKPHAYTVRLNDEGLVATDFRSHPKFAKRIRRAFLPLWSLLHLWDLWADPFCPQLSFGFSATFGPVFVLEDWVAQRTGVNETFTVIQAGAGNSTANLGQQGPRLTSTSTTNQYAEMNRFFINFNTDGITGAVVSATLGLFGHQKNADLGTNDMHIAGHNSTFVDAASNSDYQNVLSVSFGSITYAGFATGSYNDISLNASGIAAVNRTGYTKLCCRLAWDINNNFTGTWVNPGVTELISRTKDFAGGTAEDPKLTVVYDTKSFPLRPNTRPGRFKPCISR